MTHIQKITYWKEEINETLARPNQQLYFQEQNKSENVEFLELHQP